MQDKIFGPVFPYTNLDREIEKINSKPKPPALCIFDKRIVR
ncbi:hypothetical protein LEP1GSC125_0071 [Leptospira mayottensis 200901122]|uniref:Uncharacterized protein n=1 Tax=Leptospira mayottensis 200901122 TaxID=1193010 RepID=A0AA87MRF9_9LEPT|nr:hypothetical protein LEP1GSC125_0071 [Leptospira mayottensis 200901122]